MNVRAEKTFTIELTDDEINIDVDDAVMAIAINNSSVVAGSWQGDPDLTIDGKASTPLSITAGTPVVITPAKPSGILDNITITAPTGCTLQIMMQR